MFLSPVFILTSDVTVAFSYVEDGASYFIKNKSGYYLDINSGKLALNTDQNCSNMEFKIQLNDDGSFSIIPKYSTNKVLTINENTNDVDFEYFSNDISQKFKFTRLGNVYRIMVGYYEGEGNFAYVLGIDDSTISIGSDVKSLNYNPDNLGGNGQVWYLELHQHTHDIIYGDYTYHRVECNIEGSFLESHEWVYDGTKTYCKKCGMVNDRIFPFDLLKNILEQNEEEIYE